MMVPGVQGPELDEATSNPASGTPSRRPGLWQRLNAWFGEMLGEDEKAVRDLILLLVGTLGLFSLSTSVGLLDRFVDWANKHQSYGVLHWTTLGVILAGAFIIFSVRRWHDLQQEVDRRCEMEGRLREERQRLAEVVATQRRLALATHDLQEVLEGAVVEATGLTRATGATIETLQGDALKVRAAVGALAGMVGQEHLNEGTLAARCVETGELTMWTRSNDLALGPLPENARDRYASALAVPLSYHRETFGVLLVTSPEPEAFSHLDRQALQLIAGSVAAALSHATAFEEQQTLLNELSAALQRLRRTNSFFRMLQSVATAANQAEDPVEAAAVVLEEACEYTGFRAGTLFVVDPSADGALRNTGHWHDDGEIRFPGLEESLQGLTLPDGQGLAGRVLETGEALWLPDVGNRQGLLSELEGHGGEVASALAFPILAGDRVVGVVELFHDRITEDDGSTLGLLEHLGSQVGHVFERDHAQRTLNAYAGRLERSNEELQQFAYVASHDLQEPLRMVSSYVQLLQRRYGDELEPDAHDFIDYAVDGVGRMKELIRALLQYSRVESQARTFEPTDLEDTLETAIADLAVTIEDRGAQITYDQLPTIQADPLQVVQLFENLISNAIKFTPEGRSPRIRVAVHREDGAWRIAVKDNGIGIAPEHQDRIFTIFQRLHSRETYPGTGIGLAVCKRIVERHGGEIAVESTPGEGSTFIVHLPKTPPVEDDPQIQASVVELSGHSDDLGPADHGISP